MAKHSRTPKYKDADSAHISKPGKGTYLKRVIFILAVLVIVGVIIDLARPSHVSDTAGDSRTQVVQETKPAAKKATTNSTKPKPVETPVSVSMCSGNNLSQLIVVSISQRHMWACDQQAVLYNSPVVTGMENLAADLTPTGTYHIYAKETDVYLRGSDSTGSWDDYVYYWMPFLSNQYGTYGFHDATWRPANAFGNISPYSSDASHGCVELPLATAKWLFGWAVVGTQLNIVS